MESNERQEQLIADTLWVEQTLRFELARSEEALAALGADLVTDTPAPAVLQARLAQMFKNGHELQRLVWLDAHGQVLAHRGLDLPPAGLTASSRNAEAMSRATHAGRYSDPYGVTPLVHGLIDFYLPLYHEGAYVGSLVATYNLQSLLDENVPWWFAQENALSLLDRDDAVAARRAAGGPGRGVYTHKRPFDLPGATIVLATDSVKGAPKLLPNLLVGSVIVLALGLVMSLLALWRHIARTIAAEKRAAPADGLPHGDGRLAADRPARARPRRPRHLRQPGLLPHGRLAGRSAAGQEAADVLLGAGSARRVRGTLPEDPGRRSHAAVRDRVPARRWHARAGAGIRGAAGRQRWPPHRLDEFRARHHRPQARRGAQPPAAGKARDQRPPGDDGRDLVDAGARIEPAAGRDLQLHRGRAERAGARRRRRRRSAGRAARPGHAAAARSNRPTPRRGGPARSSAACTNS